jgi:dimethylamine/trimethylamine dehydrogenase
MEQHRIELRLLEMGVTLAAKQTLAAVSPGRVQTRCNATGRVAQRDAVSLVLVTSRVPGNALYFALAGEDESQLSKLPFSLIRIGDCMAPSTIAQAVYDGHRFAREIDERPDPDAVPFRREQALIHPAGG